MEGLTPEEQEEYNIALKKGNKVMKILLIIGLIVVVLSALFLKK